MTGCPVFTITCTARSSQSSVISISFSLVTCNLAPICSSHQSSIAVRIASTLGDNEFPMLVLDCKEQTITEETEKREILNSWTFQGFLEK